MAGITSTGFEVPTWEEIYQAFARRWEQSTGATLSDDKPEGQFFKAIAEQLSNKGLNESIVDALWPALHDIFFSGFITTARGIALDYLSKLVLRDGRRPAQPAKTTVWVQGRPDTTVPAGALILKGPNDVRFKNAREFTINSAGISYVPVVATEPGEQGNIAAGTLVLDETLTEFFGITEAGNSPVTHIINVGLNITTYAPIPDDELTTRYQVFSLAGYDLIDSITVFAKNTHETSKVFELLLLLYDHTTEEKIARTPVQRFVLAPNQTAEITFSALNIDCYGHEQIRCIPIVLHGSGALALGFDDGGSSWYVEGQEQGKALRIRFVTGAGGPATGGASIESDLSLRRRHWEALYSSGWGTPEAIRSQLVQLPGVMFARIEVNPELTPKTIRGLEVPPKGIAVVVWGGDPDDIAEVLHRHVPFYTAMGGNVTRSVVGINGQLFPIKFYRPTPRMVRGIIRAFPTEQFPANGVRLLKDALVQYVGGIDSYQREHAGVPPGDPLYHSQALAAMHKAVSGLGGLELLWNFEGMPPGEINLIPQALEKPFATPDMFAVYLSGRPLP